MRTKIYYFIQYHERHCLFSSERRAELYVSKNGTHSDLSEVTVAALLDKGASFRVMFFAHDFLSEKMSVVTTFVNVATVVHIADLCMTYRVFITCYEVNFFDSLCYSFGKNSGHLYLERNAR